MTKTKFVTIVVVLILAALPLNVAFADGNGPNAINFGPAWCEDGSQFDIVVSPSGNSAVTQDPDSTRVGVAFSIFLFDPEDNLVQTISDKPGNQPTVWCTWVNADIPTGFYFGGDILLTPARP